MELRQYLSLVRKWGWLIALIIILASGSSYFYSRTIPPTYRTEVTLLVGQQQTANSTSVDLNSTSNLAQAYASLVTQPALLQAAADAIKYPESWQSLYFRVSASASGGQLIRISATSSDPAQAQAIANELARQLILQSPVSQQQQQAESQREFITRQQDRLKGQIEKAQKQLDALESQLGLEADPEQSDRLDTQISTLQAKIDSWQKTYADLSGLLSSPSEKFLTILAPAPLPTSPISPNVPQNVLFATLAGLVVAGATVLFLEYLDDTIKHPDDARRVLGLPTLGAISRIANVHQAPDNLVTLKHPRSPISEAYRVMRTNLRFSGIENPEGAVLVTSAGPGEGKTTTAANMAVALAQAGKRVVLVDTDLRRPTLHHFFGLPNDVGLTTLFLDDAPSLDAVVQQTSTEGLCVLTSGQIPPNPAEMLESKKMSDLLTQLRSDSDMVVLDSPPALAVADASIIGSRCSGAVVVIDAGRTRTEAARRVVENLTQTKVKVLGVILNKLDVKRGSGYYYQYYYNYSAQNENAEENKRTGKRHKA